MSRPHPQAFRAAVLADRGRMSASVSAMKHGVAQGVVSGIWFRAKVAGQVAPLAGRYDGSKVVQLRVSRTRDNTRRGELAVEGELTPATFIAAAVERIEMPRGVSRASNGVSVPRLSFLDAAAPRAPAGRGEVSP